MSVLASSLDFRRAGALLLFRAPYTTGSTRHIPGWSWRVGPLRQRRESASRCLFSSPGAVLESPGVKNSITCAALFAAETCRFVLLVIHPVGSHQPHDRIPAALSTV